MDRVILIGSFLEIIELCEKCGYTIVGIVDNSNIDFHPYPYLGTDDIFIENYLRYLNIPLVITPDNPIVRDKLFKKYRRIGFKFKTIIAPDANISKCAKIAEGCMIQSFCNISSNVYLGECVRVNTGANIMHDVHIDKFSVVAPNAVLLGCVSIGSRSYIGANSTILPHLCIGNDATIGAGAVVTKDVTDDTVVVGVPAHFL